MVPITDSLFTIYRKEIPFTNFNEPFYLIPFGDIHRFAFNCHQTKWLEFLDWCKKEQKKNKRIYYLGMGDYDDLASTTERARVSAANFHDTTTESLDKLARDRTQKFIDEISFMKGRIIGMIEGNHNWKFASGQTSTMMMCEQLGAPYFGLSCFFRLVFCYKKGGRRISLDAWAHHGRGGGKRLGSSVNSVEDMERVAEADMYLMGHDHKKWVAYRNRLKLSHGNKNMHVKYRKVLLARTGSFQIGYMPGHGSYTNSLALPPTDLGVVKIILTPVNKKTRIRNGKREEDNYIDIHASI